jgi:hypothetical protein
MKRLAAIILLLCLCHIACAQNTKADYIKRTQIITRDTNFALGQFFVAWEAMEAANATTRRKESDEEIGERKLQRDAARAALLKSMPVVRANAKRMRSISPVPRFYKKADDRFIDAGYALDSAMSSLESWLIQPSDMWKSQTEKHARKALTDIDAATRALSERSEAGVVNKTYTD